MPKVKDSTLKAISCGLLVVLRSDKMTHILLDLVHEITPRFQQISRKFADFLIISPRERFEFFRIQTIMNDGAPSCFLGVVSVACVCFIDLGYQSRDE